MANKDHEAHLRDLRAKYAGRKAAGLCPGCGLFPKPSGKTLCASCLRFRNIRVFVTKYGCPTDEQAEIWYDLCIAGYCDICGKGAHEGRHRRRQLCPDHAHLSTPAARGCLCSDCNRKLGVFEHIVSLGGIDMSASNNPYVKYLRERDQRYGGCFDPASVLESYKHV